MQFSAVVNTRHTSKVEEIFSQNTVLATEVKEDATVTAGHLTVIGNYRGYTLNSKQGRKAQDAGKDVLDLSSLRIVPVSELGLLAEKLEGFLRDYNENDVTSMLRELEANLAD